MADGCSEDGSTRVLRFTLLGALLALTLGCPGGDPLARRAGTRRLDVDLTLLIRSG